MLASPKKLIQRMTDPFGFHDALRDLSLAPEDMPGMTRDCRQLGQGC